MLNPSQRYFPLYETKTLAFTMNPNNNREVFIMNSNISNDMLDKPLEVAGFNLMDAESNSGNKRKSSGSFSDNPEASAKKTKTDDTKLTSTDITESKNTQSVNNQPQLVQQSDVHKTQQAYPNLHHPLPINLAKAAQNKILNVYNKD